MLSNINIMTTNKLDLIDDLSLDECEEKIGIAKIRLRQSQLHLSAVLAGFFEVDRLLTIWSTKASVPVECEFEVIFTDGKFIKGTYELGRSATRRPSLCGFIRTCLLMAPSQNSVNCKHVKNTIVGEWGEILDGSILEHYEIERNANEKPPRTSRTNGCAN
jgi:hypothetical protein